ncbi:hypothetical protein K456DRAFT_336704 [Colletotrichum gloeosporioides 23]|nr:hypothetical protein K456DRAFT_336704 [Colletotrichum gloeosporioides 23]
MQSETRKTDSQYVLPSKDELSRFIARYFGSFHRHQPFLHEPTWSASRSPVMLVLAVCANGALYSLERPTAFGLYKMAVQMTSLTDEGIHALQTMMLLTAFAAWSGTKEDLRTALQFHGRLAFAIRQEWALSEYGEGAETTTWEAWLARESLKRVTFCIFTLMNLMTTAYDIPSPLLLEAQHGMPAHEKQWCARTEVDWAGAMRCAGNQTWPSAHVIVERLVDEFLPVPSPIGMFGCHVLISFLLQKIILLRRSCPTQDVIYLENRRYFMRALQRWQLMWESEPEASLTPDHPQGPILFNCTALLRVAYIR